MLAVTPRRAQTRRPIWAALLLAAGLIGFAHAQEPARPAAPPGEEEEVTPAKPAKRIPVEEPPTQKEPDKAKPPAAGETPPEQEEGGDKGVYVAKLDDVARAAAAAADPAVKQYLAGLGFAYDVLGDSRFKSQRITPVPLLWGKDRFPDEFGYAPLDADNNVGEVKSVRRQLVRDIQPFERIALEKTAAFLKPATETGGPKPAEKLAAAERVLTAVMFFHDSARDQNRRRGKNWDEVKTEVYDRLTAVRVDRVKQAAADKDFVRLKELSARLTALYKGNPKVLEPVFAARLAEAEELVKSEKVTDLEKGAVLLSEYESRFPNTGNEAAKRVRAALATRASAFLKEAERLRGTDKTQARNLLQTVRAINPDDPTLRQMQKEIREGYAVLVVGARRLPELMSPALARFDSEHQACELMFEGLFEAVPDEFAGVRFRPSLAAEWPGIGAGVRDVQLVRNAEWAGPGGGVFDATSVADTLNMLRLKPGSWAADYVSWLDEPGFDPSDPGRIKLRFKVGHPDPRQLLTLKLQPARQLLEKNKQIDDAEFARKPFGTGPFKLHPDYRPPKPGEQQREVVFVSNPAYARRPGRMAQPAIQEIHFADVTQYPDLAAEFRGDRLHVLTDVPTPELAKYTADGNLGGKVRVVTAAQNRRVHLLAINQRRPALQSVDVRKAISGAIDRQRVLNEVYRGGKADAHKAMTGPFPPESWATPRGIGPAGLYDRNVAQARFRKYFENPNAAAALSLLFPNDDPYAKGACDRIKNMVESATAADDRKITINLEPVSPRELIRRVEEEQRYDLAYLHHDYRDDWYQLGLGSFLDPAAAGPGGRNYLGYLAKGTNPTEADSQFGALLAEIRLHRDPGKLLDLTHKAHKQFNDQMPFVPLWQLDRNTVIATSVKVYLDGQVEEANPRLLNPTMLFSSVGRWRVE
ncbi:MAG TPA: ABC transporter substrate-binding protein [Fimbriiglobus sp.]|nr:ABC transporter substrate-binding protein [Fimbriiglobus sp.]